MKMRNIAYRINYMIIILVLSSCSVTNLNSRGYKKLGQDKFAKAEKLFMRSVKKSGYNPKALLGLGIISAKRDKHRKAVGYLTKSIDYGNKYAQLVRADSWYEIAKEYKGLGDFYKSLLNVDKSLRDNPNLAKSDTLKSQVLVSIANLKENAAKYEEALDYRKRALSIFPRDGMLQGAVIRLHNKLAIIGLTNNNLDKALSHVNSAISMGNAYTWIASKKIRSRIYHAYSVKENNIDSQLNYVNKALHDNSDNKALNTYAFNLYLYMASVFIDQRYYSKAEDVFRRANEINPIYEETYKLLSENSDDTDGPDYQVAISEIYGLNMRHQDAINILNRYKGRYFWLKPRVIFNLAKHYAVIGEHNKSVNYLRSFYTDSYLNYYYKEYRDKVSGDASFALLEKNQAFYRWLNGINRVEISLSHLDNIPNHDLIGGPSDPYVVISHLNNVILSTPKKQDVWSIKWVKNRYKAVFDYDFDEVINITVTDSDGTFDDLISDTYHKGRFLGKQNIILDESSEMTLNLEIKDCSWCPSVYSTYTSLPPKLWFWEVLQDNRINKGLSALETISDSKIEQEHLQAYDSYFNFLGFTKFLSCFGSAGVSRYKSGFISRQLIYGTIDYIDDGDISFRRLGRDGIIEYVVKKIGNQFFENINTLRTFCECIYNKIQ